MDGRYLKITRGFSLWFTGLPSSGKTTVAREVVKLLESYSLPVVFLDGDVIRPIIAADVGRSESERYKSLLRYIGLTTLLVNSKIITILAVINHSEKQREMARGSHPAGQFAEVWIDTPLLTCIERDVKGLYKKAIDGELEDVVGVSIEYEIPQASDIVISVPETSPQDAAEKILEYLWDAEVVVE